MDSPLDGLWVEDVSDFAVRQLDRRLHSRPDIRAELRRHDLENVISLLCQIVANETATMRTEHVLGVVSDLLGTVSSLDDVDHIRRRIDTIRLGEMPTELENH